MLLYVWGPDILRPLFILVLSLRHLMAQIDQYHVVSRDMFRDIMPYNCQRYVAQLDTIMECVPLCSIPTRPRCHALASGLGDCWVCGEGVSGPLAAENIPASTTLWVHSGE